MRVGIENYPYLNERVAATHELVAEIAELAARLGRRVATPAEVRAILKGALLSFTRALAWEVAADHIRVNSLSPGSVDMPMLRADVTGEAARTGRSFEKLKRERENEQAFHRWADPREIAEAVYFLASEAASFVTGSDLLVDGGWVAK